MSKIIGYFCKCYNLSSNYIFKNMDDKDSKDSISDISDKYNLIKIYNFINIHCIIIYNFHKF